MAIQQRRAWWSLGIWVVVSLAILALFIARGPLSFHEDQGMRLSVYGCILAGWLGQWAMTCLTRPKPGGAEVVMDERDRMIRSRALTVQSGAVLISLAAWSVALTENYWDRGQIPIVYPYLIFLSCLIVYVLALPAGIVIGYWRSASYGEG